MSERFVRLLAILAILALPAVARAQEASIGGTVRDTGYEQLEEACHEGNRSRESSLSIGMKRYTGVVPPRN